MATMTMSKPKQSAAFDVKKPTPVSDEQHAEVVRKFSRDCVEVDFTIHRLPTARKARGKAAEAVRAAVGASKRGAKTTWNMFQASAHRDTPTNDPGVKAVKALNAAITDLERFRDNRTLTKSEDVGVTEDGQVKIEAGKRLLFADEAADFYTEACVLAERIDDAVATVVQNLEAIKDNDRRHAGDLWDESEYKLDLVNRVGVRKDVSGQYVIDFGPPRDYTVLPPEVADKAVRWAESKMTTSIETAVESVTDTLNKALSTFLGELTSRVRIDPVDDHPWKKFCEHGNAEVLKTKIHEQDASVPEGQVKVYLSFKAPSVDAVLASDDATSTVQFDQSALGKHSTWVGPIPVAEYEQKVRPQATEERKKIYPQVIEGLIAQMQALREHKAKMLGAYGDNLTGTMGALLSTLNQMKRLGDDNAEVADRVATALKRDYDFRKDVADVVADTIEALEENVEQVRTVRRRIFRKPVE